MENIIDFTKILWLKEVGTRKKKNEWAYPVKEGDIFNLDWPNVSTKLVEKPQIGEVILLKQKQWLSHLVVPYTSIVGKNPNNKWFPYFRKVICLKMFNENEAPEIINYIRYSLKGPPLGNCREIAMLRKNFSDIPVDKVQKDIFRLCFESLDPFPISLSENELSMIEDYEALEGKITFIYILHRRRERNHKLIEEAKKKRLKEKGTLVCDVCGFSFSQKYGDRGKDFIEAHHTIPISIRKPEGSKTKINDLALVCSNCHRMLHREPWFKIDELKSIVKN